MLKPVVLARRALTRSVSMSQLVRHVDVQPLASSADSFVQPLASAHYFGKSVDLGWGRIYGGQTMAQGLAACQRLAGESRSVHQFGCHFLRAGDTKLDVRFEAEELQTGRSFTVVHVRALQGQAPILAMTASLQTPEEGLEHTLGGGAPLPREWKTPHELKTLGECMQPYLDRVPERLHGLFEDTPLDVRPADFVTPWDDAVRPASRAVWIRSKQALPDDASVHERLLTYVSDWGFLETAIYPHGTALWRPELQVSSLSHSIHFHRPFRLDQQWLCYHIVAPSTSGARGMVRGEFWTEDGVLVASTTQEGLMRLRAKAPPSKNGDVAAAFHKDASAPIK